MTPTVIDPYKALKDIERIALEGRRDIVAKRAINGHEALRKCQEIANDAQRWAADRHEEAA